MMERVKTLAKIVVVPGRVPLGPQFDQYYIAPIDLYVLFSECEYDVVTRRYYGVRKLHNKIIQEARLPDLDPQDINYASVDVKYTDKYHTYFSVNRRGYMLSDDQVSYLKDMFDSDF